MQSTHLLGITSGASLHPVTIHHAGVLKLLSKVSYSTFCLFSPLPPQTPPLLNVSCDLYHVPLYFKNLLFPDLWRRVKLFKISSKSYRLFFVPRTSTHHSHLMFTTLFFLYLSFQFSFSFNVSLHLWAPIYMFITTLVTCTLCPSSKLLKLLFFYK